MNVDSLLIEIIGWSVQCINRIEASWRPRYERL